MLDYRSKIKQNRLNQFIELLENYFSNHQGITLENFQTVEFGDLFESVLRRVVQTRSIDKLNIYKNILINKLSYPELDIDHSEIFLDLITTLSLIEIKVLHEHREFEKYFKNEQDEYNVLQNALKSTTQNLKWVIQQPIGHEGEDKKFRTEIGEIKSKIRDKKNTIDKWQEIRKHTYYNITESNFLFYKQRLLSKGLLIYAGVGAIGGNSFQNMTITELGTQFIDYIVNSSPI